MPEINSTPSSLPVSLPHYSAVSIGDPELPDNIRDNATHVEPPHTLNHLRKPSWERFTGKDREPIGIFASLKEIALSSGLNIFLIFIPLAWIAYFFNWKEPLVFALCFLSIIPLTRLFDFGGEQMALYCGKQLGDLVIITLNNAVEATVAMVLLTRCELKLLQSTIAGGVLLRLLLVPGMAFLTGGARIDQKLHPRQTELNHTLLTIGILSLLVPTTFFSALNPGPAINAAKASNVNNTAKTQDKPFLNDTLRADILAISRGISVILLIVYICSRIYWHKPPGRKHSTQPHPDSPEEYIQEEQKLALQTPIVNPWVCFCMLFLTVGVMAATVEFLVRSTNFVREGSKFTTEFFGLILLPLVSFSANAVVAIMYFVRAAFFIDSEPPVALAKSRAIDLSIQFTLFWMPFIVLLGWWINKPLSLLFDLYEFSAWIGACFLVNCITAGARTNWAEGLILCAFYLMIALPSWYYKGQVEVHELLQCGGVLVTLQKVASSGEGSLE